MAGTPFVIPGILQKHFEELEFLLGQCLRAVRSPDYRARDLLWLEERIEANVDGLLVAGEEAMPLLEEALSGDDPRVTFAAAYVLLRMDNEAGIHGLMNAFLQANEQQLDGIRAALCHCPSDKFIEQLRKLLVSSPSSIAVAAAEVLVFHRKLKSLPSRLNEFLKDESPWVRRSAWRVMAMLSAIPSQ